MRVRYPGKRFTCWPAALLLLICQWAPITPCLAQGAAGGDQTQPTAPPGDSDESQQAPFVFTAPEDVGVPEEYLNAVAYLGNYREAWSLDALLEPDAGHVFLALQDRATRQDLEKLEIPDLDLVLEELIASRVIRQTGDSFRPAFPLLRGAAGAGFDQAVRKAADSVYPQLRSYFKKAQKAAKKEKLSAWLFTLVWSELLDSRSAEESLIDAGALDSQRMRDEGYLWMQLPRDPFLVGVDRYGSGSETLHYLWTPVSYLNPSVQSFTIRRQILDESLAHLPWLDADSMEALQALGIVDAEKKVAVPALKKSSALLAVLREASQVYVRQALAALRGEALAKTLGVPRDEAFAAAFGTLGFRIMEKAIQDGWFRAPEYLFKELSPPGKMVEALVVTSNEAPRPLDRAYYLYDKDDLAGSIQLINDFLKEHPDDPEAIFRLGIAQMKQRKYPEALASFERGIALPARSQDVWRGWFQIRAGNTLDMLNRRDDALLHYQQALLCADVNGSRDTARQWLDNIYRD
jgi:tetratricopeptide (TPR) repeat protein